MQFWYSQHKKDVKVFESTERGATKLLQGFSHPVRRGRGHVGCPVWRRLKGDLTALCTFLRGEAKGCAGVSSWELRTEHEETGKGCVKGCSDWN